MRLALYQPDIAQNAGAIVRLAACLGLPVDVIGPCGFLWDEPRMRRVGMDYGELAVVSHHESWAAYLAHRADSGAGRLLLLSTKAAHSPYEFSFAIHDTLLLGRESAGVPEVVHAVADARLRIPTQPGTRSLNIVTAAALVAGEALRQTGGWPP